MKVWNGKRPHGGHKVENYTLRDQKQQVWMGIHIFKSDLLSYCDFLYSVSEEKSID